MTHSLPPPDLVDGAHYMLPNGECVQPVHLPGGASWFLESPTRTSGSVVVRQRGGGLANGADRQVIDARHPRAGSPAEIRATRRVVACLTQQKGHSAIRL